MAGSGRVVMAGVGWAVLAAWAPVFWAVTLPCAVLLSAALIRALRRGELSMSVPGAVPAVLALVGSLQLAAGLTESRFATVAAILMWVACAALVFLAEQCSQSETLTALSWLAGAIGVTAILVHFTSTYRVFWIFPAQYEQVFGPYVYRNHYAAFAELTLPPALYLACRRREQRELFVLIAAVLAAGVVVAQSRAGAILVGAEIVTVLGVAGARGLLSVKLASVLAVSLLGGALVVGYSGLANRFEERNPWHVRAEIVKSSLDMWRERPATGWGLGTWRGLYPSYARIDPGVLVNEAHNDWVQWGCDGGVIGVLAMLALAGWCAWRGVQTIWGLGVSFVFVHGAVDYPFQEPSILLLTMLLAGMMVKRKIHSKRA